MNTQIIHTLLLGGAFLALFATGELLYHFVKMQAEHSRKLIHFGTGILTLLFPVLLENHWFVLLLCASFALILQFSLRFNFLKSINAIDRKSHGSISYPVAVYGTFLAYIYPVSSAQGHDLRSYYIPILVLAVCDPLAALFGKKFPFRPFKVGKGKKTIMGTSVFFVSSFFLCWWLLSMGSCQSLSNGLIVAFTLAVVTTVTEAFSRNGFDNLLIPAAAILILYFFSHFTNFYSAC